MRSNEKRRFSREYKLAALSRLEPGSNVSAVAQELGIPREYLYKWRARYLAGGEAALRGPGRQTVSQRVAMRSGAALGELGGAPLPLPEPLDEAQQRIAELERKIGRQELELDFFRRALQQVEDARRASGVAGETASTRSSRR